MDFATTADQVTSLVDDAIGRAEALLDGVVTATERTRDTVLAPLDAIDDELGRAYGAGAFLAQVHPDEGLRDAARAAGERLQRWQVGMVFRDDLHEAVSGYAATDDAAALTGEHARLLAFLQRDLRRAGHELAPDDRAELQAISERLVEIGTAFQKHLADDDSGIDVRPEDLSGLPDGYLGSLEPGEQDGTHRVTMAYPHVLPLFDRADRRELRQQVDRLFNNRARDRNTPLLVEAVRLRRRAAELLGQPSWAHHQLEVRMAGTYEAVEGFYDELVPPLTEAGREEVEVLRRMLAADTGDDDVVLQRWDWRYYHSRLQREAGVDAVEVSGYFELEATLTGMLDLCSEVFGLVHVPVELPTWHDEVRSYEVSDSASGEVLATVHMDLHPRPGTFGHAAAFTLTPGRALPGGGYQQPVSAIVANFPRATADQPALLEHPQVETLFHEYGHILHQVLTRAALVRFSGTSVERDFVEAPSQIMEHWTWDPDVLARFARHHATGEVIPADLVERMLAVRDLDQAITKLRQVQFGWLDLQLHGPDGPDLDLEEVTAAASAKALMPKPPDTFFPATFAHIIGGYDAGYYGYLWAEVIGDDMFSRFAEQGVTSPRVGADYRREVLEPGGSRDATEHVVAFLGREPSNAAFLAKLGIDPG